jgi:CheY-like chemotaxis protein
LAAGVAHDFNNLLTVVNGYCGFVLERLNPQDEIYEEVSEIGKAGERAATLTRQLLAFSRKQMFQPRVFNLNSTVAEMDRMLRRLIGEDIDLVTKLDPALNLVKADPSQMEQVIMNLAVNARDAMPKGGNLTIETNNLTLEGPLSTRHPVLSASGSYIMLAISDSGTGMDAKTQARIFEPFYTTKGPGKGTGLGLSTVYGIVEQSGGLILVYSEVGHGTTFKVYLPAVNAAPTVEEEAPTAVRPACAETVLLVEDEDGVRTLVSRILKKQGYGVLSASNGSEAIQVSQQHAGRIDLLITDIVMPAMGGAELAQRITTYRPEVKVLFTSGYTDQAIVHHGVLTDETPFLAKPFAPRTLARKVREVLDGSVL